MPLSFSELVEAAGPLGVIRAAKERAWRQYCHWRRLEELTQAIDAEPIAPEPEAIPEEPSGIVAVEPARPARRPIVDVHRTSRKRQRIGLDNMLLVVGLHGEIELDTLADQAGLSQSTVEQYLKLRSDLFERVERGRYKLSEAGEQARQVVRVKRDTAEATA